MRGSARLLAEERGVRVWVQKAVRLLDKQGESVWGQWQRNQNNFHIKWNSSYKHSALSLCLYDSRKLTFCNRNKYSQFYYDIPKDVVGHIGTFFMRLPTDVRIDTPKLDCRRGFYALSELQNIG
ncbi:hypothetical protein AVEN_267625-1 [Araneus ventricosus]|uniref:Uncharacterized protein n=1 Tax=Araneus ventricosus TaxID=182803 RepID=A0A4Y2PWT2_ARAVE|nr:hypothetical protein AVEN_267625-1 [Araneus ventricosus]